MACPLIEIREIQHDSCLPRELDDRLMGRVLRIGTKAREIAEDLQRDEDLYRGYQPKTYR